MVRVGAHSKEKSTVGFQKNMTPEELVSEIKRIDDAMTFFCSADSIGVRATQLDEPQAWIERVLDRTEIISIVYSALFDQFVQLSDELLAVDPDSKHCLALKKHVASEINAATAETYWCTGDASDPYGIVPNLPDRCFVELCYVSSPGSKISVWMGDLPDETERALRLKLASQGVSRSMLFANRPGAWQWYDAATSGPSEAGG
jgi:hypothetical protein